MRVLTDKILQAFESHGNLHVVLGVSSGQVTASGDDLSDTVVTLVIPGGCAHKFSSDLVTAVSELLSGKASVSSESPHPLETSEYLGEGVKLPS